MSSSSPPSTITTISTTTTAAATITNSVVVVSAAVMSAAITASSGKRSYGLPYFLTYLVRVLGEHTRAAAAAATTTACEMVDTPLGSVAVTSAALVVHLEDHLAVDQFSQDGLRLAETYSVFAL